MIKLIFKFSNIKENSFRRSKIKIKVWKYPEWDEGQDKMNLRWSGNKIPFLRLVEHTH